MIYCHLSQPIRLLSMISSLKIDRNFLFILYAVQKMLSRKTTKSALPSLLHSLRQRCQQRRHLRIRHHFGQHLRINPLRHFHHFPLYRIPRCITHSLLQSENPCTPFKCSQKFHISIPALTTRFFDKKRRPPAITADSRQEKARAYAQAHQVSSVFNYLLSTSILNGLK